MKENQTIEQFTTEDGNIILKPKKFWGLQGKELCLT